MRLLEHEASIIYLILYSLGQSKLVDSRVHSVLDFGILGASPNRISMGFVFQHVSLNAFVGTREEHQHNNLTRSYLILLR
jgi:hypothetical protein